MRRHAWERRRPEKTGLSLTGLRTSRSTAFDTAGAECADTSDWRSGPCCAIPAVRPQYREFQTLPDNQHCRRSTNFTRKTLDGSTGQKGRRLDRIVIPVKKGRPEPTYPFSVYNIRFWQENCFCHFQSPLQYTAGFHHRTGFVSTPLLPRIHGPELCP